MVHKPKTKRASLLEISDVKRWHANLSRGSPLTAEVALRRLSRMCDFLELTPQGMIDQAKQDMKGFQNSLEDLVTEFEAEGRSPGYILDLVKTAKSWLNHHDLALKRRIKVSNSTATPTIQDEQVPSKMELSKIFRASNPRVRLAEALIAFTNLRPQVLGNHDGSNGLMLQDLPELEIKNDEVKFSKVPTMIMVKPPLSKSRHKYFTFLIKEGCTYLKEYLEERLRSGEKLEGETPLIGHERARVTTRKFTMTRKISHLIRRAMRRAGVYKRPYVLRAYAITQLIVAESRGLISNPYLQFTGGHKGDIEARYSTNKGILPEQMVEDMRRAFKDCEPLLGTMEKPLSQRTVVKEAKVEALKSIAKSLLGIDLLEVKIAKENEIGRTLNQEEMIELFENEIRKVRQREEEPQKIIEEQELESSLAEGWEFVSILPSQRILVRKSS